MDVSTSATGNIFLGMSLSAVFGWVPFFISKITLQTFYHANIGHVRNWQTFMVACGIGFMVVLLIDIGCYYLWVNTFGFFPPIPFGTYVVNWYYYCSCDVCYIVIQDTKKCQKRKRDKKEIFCIFGFSSL